MAIPEDIDDAISLVARSPKRTKVKGTEVEEHDLQSLIEADRYIAAKNASSKNHLGLRFVKITPPGAS